MATNIFKDNADFFPTPVEVIEQMMMGENILGKTVLEPSAGKGDIVDWLQNNGAARVIACEKDREIRKLLEGKCEIIADDFLTVTSEQVSHIDYIVMNPPFSEGAKHILHAYEIAPAGCTIIALCNSSNLSRGYYYDTNKQLIELVELHGRNEYIGEVFSSAERRTDVSVELIKLFKHGEGENEFDGFFFSQEDEDNANIDGREGIMPYNVVRDLVNRYVATVKLFDETLEAANKINEMAKYPGTGEYNYIPIKFATVTHDGHEKIVTHQQYRNELQKYYWRIIFNKLNMEKYATKRLREQINKFVETQQHVPFTMANIYRVIDIVIQTTGQRMDKALEEAFDLICSLSAENSTAGEKWKTNSNYMVNRKFIVNYICQGYDRYDNNRPYPTLNFGFSSSCNLDQMQDICKALCYLTGCEYNSIESLSSHGSSYRGERGEPWGKWFTWGFFRCKAFKKGTMHFEFLDEAVWSRFNRRVAELRGWALPKTTEKHGKQF